MSADRKIRDVRDLWGSGGPIQQQQVSHKQQVASHNATNVQLSNDYKNGSANMEDKENPNRIECDQYNRKKYRTLDRHLSMKKTIRKKMMRDLRDIGDASNEHVEQGGGGGIGFLEQIRTDQPPSANVDKPSFWKRLTKGWSNS